MLYFTSGMLEFLKRSNINYPEDIVKIITPLGYKGTAKYYIEEFNLPYTIDSLVNAMHEYLYPVYRDEIVLKPGVAEYLNKLKMEDHSLNVLSASPYKMVAAVLKRCGVYALFDNIWSCEDFNMTKGEPEIYREAVNRLDGTLEDTYFFDDNLEAIRAAISAGIFTIGVYDDTNADYIEKIKQISNKFINSFTDMMKDSCI